MKKLIIGIILGFVLTLPFQVKAYNNAYTEWEQEVVDLLEEIRDNGNEIIGKIETNIDAIKDQ